jgi:hypothetical protein
MVYVPLTTTTATADDYLFRNLLRIVEEYKVANSNILIQDTPDKTKYPQYTLFIPTITRTTSDMYGKNKIYFATARIDVECLYTGRGYAKCTEMHTAIENGLTAERANLYLARIDYLGSSVLANEPNEINGQNVLTRSIAFNFKIML